MEHDFIGDVHGHAGALERLLKELGYENRNGAYRHSNPDRTAVFLGDLIDRGPDQLRAVDIARRMRDAGTAQVVMGNHEFNAIGYGTRDPKRPGHFLRIRGSKNKAQHRVFLEAVGGDDTPLHNELVSWMSGLPLFMETDGFRVAHACWHQDHIDYLASHSDGNGALLPDALLQSFDKTSALMNSAEIVLKGMEVALPDGFSFNDADGNRRGKSRIRWWDETATTYDKAVIAEEGLEFLPAIELPAHTRPPDDSGKPVFFGHYWLKGTPALLSPKRACLDFSIAKEGVLCAYSWRGEADLDPRNLTWVGNDFESTPRP